MPKPIDELIEEKIEGKLGLYDTSKSRRTANEIRDRIQYELGKRKKTTHELKNALNATRSTVENHCQHLSTISVVEKVEIEGGEYWRLKE